MFASILMNTNARELNKVFDYSVPKEIEKSIKIGARVFVPFGKRNNLAEGYVLELKESSEFANKDIAKIEDFILTEENIELAKLMAEKYFCNTADCIKLMLPPGNSSKDLSKRIKEKTARFVYLCVDKDQIEEDIKIKALKSEKQIKLLNFLIDNNGIDISDLEAITEVSKSIMKTLEKNGYIKFINEKLERNPLTHKNIKKDKKLELNSEQRQAYEQVEFMLENNEFAEFLLHGITGSRKNRDIFATYRKNFRIGKKCYSFSS